MRNKEGIPRFDAQHRSPYGREARSGVSSMQRSDGNNPRLNGHDLVLDLDQFTLVESKRTAADPSGARTRDEGVSFSEANLPLSKAPGSGSGTAGNEPLSGFDILMEQAEKEFPISTAKLSSDAFENRSPRRDLRSVFRSAFGGSGSVALRRPVLKTAVVLVLTLFIGVLAYHFVGTDQYRVETKLLFFFRDQDQKSAASWPLEREIAILKSADVTRALAQEMASRMRGFSGWAGLPSKPSNAVELADWLAENLSVDSQVSGGMAKVTLCLHGEDPAVLQTVLDSYVPKYVEYRRKLEAAPGKTAPQPVVKAEPIRDDRLVAAITDQLQRIEMQQHGCELALQLFDAGSGVFSGFVPDNSLTGIASLASFQEKVVQLAIKKQAMAVKFVADSREVRAIDQEIQGVKAAMRECMVAHLEFLRKGKAQLLAQKMEFMRKASHIGKEPTPPRVQERVSVQAPDGNSWFLVRDGLYMLRDKPAITKKPMLVRAGEMKNAVLSYVTPSHSWTAISTPEAGTITIGRPQAGKKCSESRTGLFTPDRGQHWPQSPATTFSGISASGGFRTGPFQPRVPADLPVK